MLQRPNMHISFPFEDSNIPERRPCVLYTHILCHMEAQLALATYVSSCIAPPIGCEMRGLRPN